MTDLFGLSELEEAAVAYVVEKGEQDRLRYGFQNRMGEAILLKRLEAAAEKHLETERDDAAGSTSSAGRTVGANLRRDTLACRSVARP